MKIIDLTQQLFDHMPAYPGDPEVIIEEIHTIKNQGWNLRNMTFSTHIGTHVNVPYHMVQSGKTLDDFSLDIFMGKCTVYKPGMQFQKDVGVIFHDPNIDNLLADQLIKSLPKFIGISNKYEFDVAIEKKLLRHGIISYENLTNTEALPDEFFFYGLPLNIKGGDGSPVRAFAVVG
ncbi:cyclase family protein [Candidatus Gottesmanbacteria bacterium]|nr:cyclase family protein [Candidatus Gottesmanbacteria bacterium]